jgi:hypothetical protein
MKDSLRDAAQKLDAAALSDPSAQAMALAFRRLAVWIEEIEATITALARDIHNEHHDL